MATVVLAVMLMAAVFWLTDLVATWTGARSVGTRELPPVRGVVFATSVAAGHRLRGRSPSVCCPGA
ncbi:hypothetical protein [Streptomyces sp. NPDC002156]